jgi:predicted hotdog family 3-hydroxylacyl-ACP dehydratase
MLCSMLVGDIYALDFITVGDWGAAHKDTSDRETMNTVAAALAHHGSMMSLSYVLSLGDNFCKCSDPNR